MKQQRGMGAQVSRGAGTAAKRKKYKGHLVQTLDDHEGGVNCMALSEDSSVLATGKQWVKWQYSLSVGLVRGSIEQRFLSSYLFFK